MNKFMWRSWGYSVIGPWHRKNGISNQDFYLKRRYSWGTVVVVSDGLGSKPRSDVGAKAACQAVIDAAKVYKENKNADFSCIARLIHACWLLRISPFLPDDCSATCLFAIQIENEIKLGRLGDGMIIVYGKNDSFSMTEDKEDTFSNITQCLNYEFQPEQWELKSVHSDDIEAVLLCTDGISDDLISDYRIDFAREIYKIYSGMNYTKRRKDVLKWLNNWPVPGHLDDKTIACLYKTGGRK
jgi:serine/threonine protein phosphatase PrpC